MLTHPELQDEI